MEHEFVVVVHSKYSRVSQDFLDMIGELPIMVQRCISFRPLCIDSEDVRRRLKTSHQVTVDIVPSILVMYPGDVVEKYEGDDAYLWIGEAVAIVVEALKPDTSERDELTANLQRLQVQYQRDVHNYETTIKHLKQQLMQQSAESMSKPQALEAPAMPQEHRHQHQSVRTDQRTQDPRPSAPRFDNLLTIDEISENDEPKNITKIDALPSEEESDPDARTPVPQPDGTISNAFMEQPQPERGSKALEKKSSSLMAAAMNLQKGREESEPPRPPGAPDRVKA